MIRKLAALIVLAREAAHAAIALVIRTSYVAQ